MKFYQHLKAPNDTNGNPRRLYVVYSLMETGPIEKHELIPVLTAVFNEGYRGLPKELKGLSELYPVFVSATEYRNHVKLGKKLGVYQS